MLLGDILVYLRSLILTHSSSRQRLSYDDCLEDNMEGKQNCSVLCYVVHLCTLTHTHTHTCEQFLQLTVGLGLYRIRVYVYMATICWAASNSWSWCYQTNKAVPSVFSDCWLGIRKSIWPLVNWVTWCWHGYLSGMRCKWFAYGPANVTPSSLASLKSRMVLSFRCQLIRNVIGNQTVKCMLVFVPFAFT